jgi:hypothetical protein
MKKKLMKMMNVKDLLSDFDSEVHEEDLSECLFSFSK